MNAATFRIASALVVALSFTFVPASAQDKKPVKDAELLKMPKEKIKAKPVQLPTPPKVFTKQDPDSIAELREIETHVEKLVQKLTPCVVNLQVGGAEGSGVVISEDGYILTAGHVSGRPGARVIITFPDGKNVRGRSLGANGDIDSGMVKITDEGVYPFLEMGKSSELKKGQWVLTLGHPNGMKVGRPPVVRLSRILGLSNTTVTTGCYLVGGDSGGPLFDMAGKVIGIHSRIGDTINENVHVPIDTYRDTWDRLASGESWGGSIFGNPRPAYMGAELELKDGKLFFSKVESDSPAEKGGIEVGDQLISIDESKLSTLAEFRRQLLKKKPGEEAKIEVERGSKSMTLTVKLSGGPTPKRKKD